MSATASNEAPAATPIRSEQDAAGGSPTASIASGSVSDQTLIGLLQASIDRLKTTSDDQRVSNELQARDGQRTAIMLKLAQEQVERAREANDRMHRELEAARAEARRATAEATSLQQALDELETRARVTANAVDRDVKDLQVELKAERGERATLQTTIDRLRGELAECKSAAVTDAGQRDAKYRECFQELAVAKARCASQAEEIEFLESQRSKETRQVAEREFELNRSIGTLKRLLADREAEVDALKRANFEQVATLSSDGEQLRTKVIQLEGMLKATDRDGASRIVQLREENRLLRERNEADMLSAQARERALQQETATLTAHLRQAQKEVNEMADREAEHRKQGLTDVVKLHAERDALEAKAASLERQLTEARGKAQADAVSLRTEAEVAKNERVLDAQRHAVELAMKKDEVAKLKDELSMLGQQLADAQASAKRDEQALNAQVSAQLNDIRSLRAEVAGYKDNVAKLEQHVRDNYAVRILEDEIASLKAQNVQLKNQLTHANSALANLRVEADISETSRLRTMQEQVLEAQRRVTSLEREVRASRPLLADLVEVAQHAQCLDAALQEDVDKFFIQFGNTSLAR